MPISSTMCIFPAERLGENFIKKEGDISLLMAAVGLGHPRLRMSWGTPERRAGQTGGSRESLVLESVKIAIAAGVDPNLENADGLSAWTMPRHGVMNR